MPVDTLKTIKQVEGKDGFKVLMAKMKTHGPGVMYHGALAAFAANLLGHYPWFATYNYLQENLPKTDDFKMKLCRNAVIGFCSSAISDTVSNSVRVVKVGSRDGGRAGRRCWGGKRETGEGGGREGGRTDGRSP
ncbi:mitochondrial carrier domain-containing protein [Nannochloropsis gaditana]|uniref:Mitochondrial carrier domain-containing protein n=1 Tax=Nannochloropsis gaditana TaxID=72520 RepID=W7T904_9STRA|nr:mitochondrial carrier domain-containing protein [Nannochloropsis gaditana]